MSSRSLMYICYGDVCLSSLMHVVGHAKRTRDRSVSLFLFLLPLPEDGVPDYAMLCYVTLRYAISHRAHNTTDTRRHARIHTQNTEKNDIHWCGRDGRPTLTPRSPSLVNGDPPCTRQSSCPLDPSSLIAKKFQSPTPCAKLLLLALEGLYIDPTSIGLSSPSTASPST